MQSWRITKIPSGVSSMEWAAWVETQGTELLSMGIPEDFLREETCWDDFVGNGRMHYEKPTTQFSVDDIDIKHLPRLMEIIEASYPHDSLTLGDAYLWIRIRLGLPMAPE